MENEELIRRDMERTREALTDKLEILEDKVIHSVQQATSAVTETVATVKETVHEGVETVKDAVDISSHVDKHPWLMLGGAMMTGYVMGTLLFGAEKPVRREEKPGGASGALRSHGQGNGHHKPRTEKSQAPASTSSWMTMLEPEIEKFKGLALGVALGTVREALTAEIPPHLAEQVGQIIDAVTLKVGGNPLPSADLPFANKEVSDQARSSAFEADKPRW